MHRGRLYLPLIAGMGTTVLLLVGLSGLGDAPSPQRPAQEMATHFAERRRDILLAAPFGYAGVAALAFFAAHVVQRLLAAGQRAAAVVVAIGAAIVAAYHAGIHVVFTTLAYEASESADTTKSLFVLTILAVPPLGAGVAAMLGGFAWGARATHLVPAWLIVVSVIGAVVSGIAVFSFAESDFFSPDVQQQVAGGVGIFWPLVCGATLAWRARRAATGEAEAGRPAT